MNFWEAHLGIGKKPEPGEIWVFDLEDQGPWPKNDSIRVRILDVKKGWVRFEWASRFRSDERMKMVLFRWCYSYLSGPENKA